LEYSVSDQPKIIDYDPEICGTTEYPITTYQPTYFLSKSFEDAKSKLKNYSKTLG
jgi:phenylalanine-4-hydroxylase